MTPAHDTSRYHGVAIALHWLIALLIIALFAAGKFMTSLDVEDPLRFDLTQWHKSFGLCVLAASICRVLWRLSHRAPGLPATMPGWERLVAGFTHLLLYFLMLAIPMTGWIMVSASPLNISTLLFNLVPVPHLPPFDTLPNKVEITELFETLHELTANTMAALVLAHIAAALRHQFFLRDDIMQRMRPDWRGSFGDGLGLFAGSLVVLAIGGWLLQAVQTEQRNRAAATAHAIAASGSSVSFAFVVMGDDMQGQFTDTEVSFNYNPESPAATTLEAIVSTASAHSGSPQIDDSLPGPDWFDSEGHPQARFASTAVSVVDATQLTMSGDLSIRESTQSIEFPLTIDLDGGTATGGFTINRLDYGIGASEQPDDTHAGLNVIIEFTLNLSQ